MVAGAPLAQELLGGSWFGFGTAPRGFPTIEEALLAVADEHPVLSLGKGEIAEVPVRFR